MVLTGRSRAAYGPRSRSEEEAMWFIVDDGRRVDWPVTTISQRSAHRRPLRFRPVLAGADCVMNTRRMTSFVFTIVPEVNVTRMR